MDGDSPNADDTNSTHCLPTAEGDKDNDHMRHDNEPPVKKRRHQYGDSPHYSQASDKHTSEGTDSSDTGINFTVQSQSGSDVPSPGSLDGGDSRPASILSAEFEPSQGDMLSDGEDTVATGTYGRVTLCRDVEDVDSESLNNDEPQDETESTLEYNVIDDNDSDSFISTTSEGFLVNTGTLETGSDIQDQCVSYADIDEDSHEYDECIDKTKELSSGGADVLSDTPVISSTDGSGGAADELSGGPDVSSRDADELSLAADESNKASDVSSSEGSNMSPNILVQDPPEACTTLQDKPDASLKEASSWDEDNLTFPIPQPSTSYIYRPESPESPKKGKEKLREVSINISLNREAENISSMLGISDTDIIYRKLKQLRNQGNRVDLVTNEILENGLDSLHSSLSQEDCAEDDCDIFDHVESVRLAVVDKIPTINPNEIYKYMEKHQSVEPVDDRVKLVINNFLKAAEMVEEEKRARQAEKTDVEGDMFNDVQLVLRQVQTANPDQVFMLLEQFVDKEHRVQMVVNALKAKVSSSAQSSDHGDVPNNLNPPRPHVRERPLLKDVDTVAALFPNRARVDILISLSHHEDANRVRIVIDELLIEQREAANQNGTNSLTQNSGVVNTPSDGTAPASDYRTPTSTINIASTSDTGTSASTSTAPLDHPGETSSSASRPGDSDYIVKLQEDVEILRRIFPDCDPDYLFSELEARAGNPERTAAVSSMMFERCNYPRLRDRLEKEHTQEKVRKLRELKLNMEEFLTMFPDPEKTFYDVSKPVTERYKQHAWQQLLNDFPMLTEGYIKKKFEAESNHYLPTLKVLDKVAEVYRSGLYLFLLLGYNNILNNNN